MNDSDPLIQQLHAMAHELSGGGPRGIKVFNQLEDRLREADKRIAELEAKLKDRPALLKSAQTHELEAECYARGDKVE